MDALLLEDWRMDKDDLYKLDREFILWITPQYHKKSLTALAAWFAKEAQSMNVLSPVQKMFEQYHCRTNDERRDALKEIVQEITLAALDRSGFFTLAAFYGGTALRVFHGLDRFSEDLDFSLAKPDPDFDLGAYFKAIRDELGSFGFDMTVEQKQKTAATAIQSAFIKGGTLIHLIRIGSLTPPVPGVPENEQLKIKIEIDRDPPAGASFETKYRLTPVPYAVRLYDGPSLFAGKLHAILCRNWKTRAKGRDFYDYLWYLSNDIPVNALHLASRMRQSGHRDATTAITRDELLALLAGRFAAVNFEQPESV
jgi:predicted nucleotidyltransferase component of viral defense system